MKEADLKQETETGYSLKQIMALINLEKSKGFSNLRVRFDSHDDERDWMLSHFRACAPDYISRIDAAGNLEIEWKRNESK
jgi:hypothetical protein